MTATPDKLLLRPAEAAALIGVRATTFWNLVKTGAIKTKKIGRATVVPRGELQRFVDTLPFPRPRSS